MSKKERKAAERLRAADQEAVAAKSFDVHIHHDRPAGSPAPQSYTAHPASDRRNHR